MKHFNIILLIFSIFTSSFLMAQKLPDLDIQWTGRLSDTDIVVMNDFYPRAELFLDGVKYHLAIDKSSRKVKYISSYDPKFRLKSLEVIGRPFNSFNNTDKLVHMPGWANFVPLADGWYAAFSFRNLTDSSKCTHVFKYRFK